MTAPPQADNLQQALQAFHAEDISVCEVACLRILERQKNHPLGIHLLAWVRHQQDEPLDELLDHIINSPETAKAGGIPAKATGGWLLWQCGRTIDAIKALTENIHREPQRHELRMLLGICLLADDQPESASEVLRTVVDGGPPNHILPIARFHLSHALLHIGQWQEGWQQFEESRFDLSVRQTGSYETFPGKLWTEQSLKGKSIVIEGEQGFGDQIQFIRLARDLKDKFGAEEVHFCCHPALQDLMQPVEFLDSAIAKVYQNFDYHVPVMSLPHRCGIRVKNIAPSLADPYLSAEPDWVEKWSSRLPISHRKRVGICWRSAPAGDPKTKKKFSGVNFVKELKSLEVGDLDFLISEVATAGYDIVSLQHDISAEEKAVLAVHDVFCEEIGNFTDTAALIELCDYVVSIDTATIHLAGAMGADCRVLLSKGADWRWTHPVWYRSVKEYRQMVERDWREPINRLVEEM